MSRLSLVDTAAPPQPVAKLLVETKRRLGVVPNMFRAMANSPALLAGYLDLSDTLSRGSLSAADRERAERPHQPFNKAVEVDVDFPVIAA